MAAAWHVVFLRGAPDLIAARLSGRSGHYMPPTLLPSQLAALEPPQDAIVVDIADSPEVVQRQVLVALPILTQNGWSGTGSPHPKPGSEKMMAQGKFFFRHDVSKQRFGLCLDAGGTSLSIESGAKAVAAADGQPKREPPKPSPGPLPAAMKRRPPNS